MARHGSYRAGRLVHRLKAPGQTQAGLLLLHRQQCAVGAVGMAGTGLGADPSAGLSVRDEPAGLEEKHGDGASLKGSCLYASQNVVPRPFVPPVSPIAQLAARAGPSNGEHPNADTA